MFSKKKSVSANIPVKVTERKPGRQRESQSQKSLCRERSWEKEPGGDVGGMGHDSMTYGEEERN